MKRYEEFLKCDYTKDEMLEMGHDLSRASQSRRSLEQQKKQIDAQLKGQIEEQNTAIERLSNAIFNGCEWRNVECRVELDTPSTGRKRIVRIDTGEEVRIILMTDEDRQLVMDLQNEAETGATEEEEQLWPFVKQEVDADGAPLAAAHLVGGTHQKRKRGKDAAAGDAQ